MIDMQYLMLVKLLLELKRNQNIYRIFLNNTISPFDKVSWRNGSALVFGSR